MSQKSKKGDGHLTTERLYATKEFDAKGFGPARWLEDESGYTTLETAASEKNPHSKVKELIKYAVPSGERTVLLSVDQITPPDSDKPLQIANYEWSADRKRMLLFTNTQRVWRDHTRGDYWVLALENGRLTQLGQALPAASLMFAKFSPNGQTVAYVSQQNIYIEAVETGDMLQLTTDGGEHIVNGTSDWAYEEEFKLRDCFSWSPDGRFIAYWQFDTSTVQTFYMINNTDDIYPKLIPLSYPKAGTTNSTCRVGVIPATGGETTWFDIVGDKNDSYIPRMEWAAASDQLIIQQMNRLQNENRILLGNVSDGSTELIHLETDEAWIDLHDDLRWLNEGESYTWRSDRNGWRQLFRQSRDGQQAVALTPPQFDVVSVSAVSEKSGWVNFIASPDNATQRYLFRAPLDGSTPPERLTPDGQSGVHRYQLSPNGRFAFHTYTAFDQPPVISLISLPDHKTIQLLESNESLRESVASIERQPVEFFRVPLPDGAELDAWCIKPPNFDPTKKYPLLFFVYGEPAAQTVVDSWAGKRNLWHTMLAQQGFVVISVDNRGTPAPRGRAWRKDTYRQVGIVSSADQAAAAKVILASRPYLDPERVGVWGWSGGGSMTLNLMFRHPDIYKVGVSVAPVSDMRLYDTIYQERYMGLPQENEEGYKNGSPITFADGLAGKVMIIHGTGDDNVHYQSAEMVINKLIALNKPFDMMAYPNRSHAIREGKNTTRHLYETITRYLQTHL